jgi:hypothetical protein
MHTHGKCIMIHNTQLQSKDASIFLLQQYVEHPHTVSAKFIDITQSFVAGIFQTTASLNIYPTTSSLTSLPQASLLLLYTWMTWVIPLSATHLEAQLSLPERKTPRAARYAARIHAYIWLRTCIHMTSVERGSLYCVFVCTKPFALIWLWKTHPLIYFNPYSVHCAKAAFRDCAHAYMYIYIYISMKIIHIFIWRLYICVCVYEDYTHKHTHICIYIYIYIYMYVCMYVCIYMKMYLK